MPIFFHLLTNDHFQRDFLNKLNTLSTFSNISLPFREVHLKEGWPRTTLLNPEQLFNVDQTLIARALKNTFSPSSAFFLVSLHRTTTGICGFHKTFVISLYMSLLFLKHVLYLALIDWLIFKGEQS